jgi:gliding motility-associated-like protein
MHGQRAIRQVLVLTGLIIAGRCIAQCDFPVRLTTSPGYCLGATLKVSSLHALAKIVWYNGSTPVKTVKDTTHPGTLTESADGLPVIDLLTWPMGLAVNDSGSIYVTDSHGCRVVKWSPGTTGWVTVAGGNGAGTDASQLTYPTSLAVDQAGNIFVADGNSRVQKWAPGAASGVTVAGGNGQGPTANQLSGELMIALDCDDNVYIADNNRIQRWAPGATSGVTVAGGNGSGSAANQLADPVSICVDGSRNVYVLDASNSRVQKWAPGATSGVTVAGGNGAGTAANQLNGPWNLFVDNNDNIYVVDIYNTTGGSGSIIRKWTPGATESIVVASHDMYNPFWGSIGVFVDSKGTIYGGVTLNTAILLQLSQPSSIDDSFTPATGGLYHAVVTDVNGYTSTTDTIPVSTPPPAPPSIQISASATSVYLCEAVNFSASVVNEGADPSYQWQVSGVNVGGDSLTWSNNLFANGDQVQCIMTTVGTSCQLVQDTSNVLTMSVDPQGHATVSIASSDPMVCGDSSVTFTATVTNGSGAPAFEWMMNGQPAGDSTAIFVDSTIGSEVVYCLIASDASCGLAKSNSIAASVYPLPVIAAGQVYNIPYGQHLTLNPSITGDVTSYLWTPGSGLSDSTIRDPVADPTTSTTYTLQVASPGGGCQAKGIITVDVYTPLSMPNAFTPNGDGHNDRLYVLGGPEGSSIRAFAIFNRWGAKVFNVENVLPGDPRYGWNGNIGGRPAPSGTYVYTVVMQLPGGLEQTYKGTVELIR